jgi:hypothetical protein
VGQQLLHGQAVLEQAHHGLQDLLLEGSELL